MNVSENPSVSKPRCPWLPEIGEIHGSHVTRRQGSDKGPGFYQDALCRAQSQWMAGKPAQALLQLNKAWMADLATDEPVLIDNPSPYQALIWILRQAGDGGCGFLGNPVRHFQHLASRVSGSRAEIRSWRAWLCFHLAEQLLDRGKFPRDGTQIAREGLWIPGFHRAMHEVAGRGWESEAEMRFLASSNGWVVGDL